METMSKYFKLDKWNEICQRSLIEIRKAQQ